MAGGVLDGGQAGREKEVQGDRRQRRQECAWRLAKLIQYRPGSPLLPSIQKNSMPARVVGDQTRREGRGEEC